MALVRTNTVNDIKWHPRHPQHGRQLRDRVASNSKEASLPKGFPICLPDNMAWDGHQLADELRYIYHLTDGDCAEIDVALAAFNACNLDGDLVNCENFPLPGLQLVLRQLGHEVHNGKGFFVLRGLDYDKYSVEDGMVIFLGIQSYIAEQRARQDDRGNMVVHIISDSTADSSPAKVLHSRHSNSGIPFHTEEAGDIIAWQTRHIAARGGKCIISSAYTIYNILAATRPDIIYTLAEPNWPFAFPYFHRRPVLFYHDSHLIINFSRAALLGSSSHPRPSNLPSITPRQREALDAVEGIANATQLEIAIRAGDMHFINNLAILHRRDEYVNDEGENGKKRHLVRMRLRSESAGWAIPEELRGSWDDAFGDIGDRVWHLEPMPEAFFTLRSNPL